MIRTLVEVDGGVTEAVSPIVVQVNALMVNWSVAVVKSELARGTANTFKCAICTSESQILYDS